MPLPASSPVPQLLELQGGNLLEASSGADAQLQLATRQFQQALAQEQLRQSEASTFSMQLDLASKRLASQQRLASAQLQQAGMAANRALDGLRQGVPGAEPMTSSLVALQRQSSVGIREPGAQQVLKEPLALPQSITQLWRQKNPALAALLLEPALYGYSLLGWVLLMAVTGVSSAFCLLGNKLPLGRTGHQLSPDAETGGTEPPQYRGSSSLSSYFQYPGGYGSVHDHPPAASRRTPMEKARLARAELEEEQEGVESWIRVPVETPSHAHPKAGHKQEWPGYLDDD